MRYRGRRYTRGGSQVDDQTGAGGVTSLFLPYLPSCASDLIHSTLDATSSHHEHQSPLLKTSNSRGVNRGHGVIHRRSLCGDNGPAGPTVKGSTRPARVHIYTPQSQEYGETRSTGAEQKDNTPMCTVRNSLPREKRRAALQFFFNVCKATANTRPSPLSFVTVQFGSQHGPFETERVVHGRHVKQGRREPRA